jgi:DNA repair exonuclease SbcCD ATPase subunit
MQAPDMENETNRNFIDSAQLGSMHNHTKPGFNNQNVGEVNNLDKVRDILFGNQMREVEKKFTRLEERLLKECGNLREDTKKRLDSIEDYIKQEVQSLSQRIANEQGSRDEGIQVLVEEHKRTTTALERKLAQLDENITTNQRDLREQILNQSKNLQNDILQKYEEILAALQRESEDLRHAKTDRSTLANLLSEMAIRLNSQQ